MTDAILLNMEERLSAQTALGMFGFKIGEFDLLKTNILFRGSQGFYLLSLKEFVYASFEKMKITCDLFENIYKKSKY